MALVPRNKALRLETDHEALLEAQGFVARPGPRPRIDEEIVRVIGKVSKPANGWRSLINPTRIRNIVHVVLLRSASCLVSAFISLPK